MKNQFEKFVKENNLYSVSVEQALQSYEKFMDKDGLHIKENREKEFIKDIEENREKCEKYLNSETHKNHLKAFQLLKEVVDKNLFIKDFFTINPVDEYYQFLPTSAMFISFWAYLLDYDFIPIYSISTENRISKEFVSKDEFYENFYRIFKYKTKEFEKETKEFLLNYKKNKFSK